MKQTWKLQNRPYFKNFCPELIPNNWKNPAQDQIQEVNWKLMSKPDQRDPLLLSGLY